MSLVHAASENNITLNTTDNAIGNTTYATNNIVINSTNVTDDTLGNTEYANNNTSNNLNDTKNSFHNSSKTVLDISFYYPANRPDDRYCLETSIQLAISYINRNQSILPDHTMKAHMFSLNRIVSTWK